MTRQADILNTMNLAAGGPLVLSTCVTPATAETEPDQETGRASLLPKQPSFCASSAPRLGSQTISVATGGESYLQEV